MLTPEDREELILDLQDFWHQEDLIRHSELMADKIEVLIERISGQEREVGYQEGWTGHSNWMGF